MKRGSQIQSDADLYEDTRTAGMPEILYCARLERIAQLKTAMLLAECGVKVLREAAPEVEPIAEGE